LSRVRLKPVESEITRAGGFDEVYLEVWNLDDVWQGLLELAVKDEG
jgi:hypothetical protein